jgi:hypothetical protein
MTMARAYAAKLILTYREVDLNGANRPTDPEALRSAAIAHFRAFLEGNRESVQAKWIGDGGSLLSSRHASRQAERASGD